MGGLSAGLQVAARWNNCRRDTYAMKDLSITYEYGMTMYISGGFFPPEGKILSPLSRTRGGILSPLSQTGRNLRPLPPCGRPWICARWFFLHIHYAVVHEVHKNERSAEKNKTNELQ